MFSGIRKAFASAVFPARCQACRVLFLPRDTAETPALAGMTEIQDVAMEDFFRKVMAPFLCRSCITRFSPMETPCCPECGKIFETGYGRDHVCGACLASKNGYQAVRSAGLLEGALMDVIHAFKYDGKIQLARPLGRILLAALLRHCNIDKLDVILPVPLHRARLRHRGFNQAVLMLREWPDFPPIQQAQIVIDNSVLARIKNTVSQTGMGRENRKANVRHAFAVNRPEMIKGKRVLLVDDVFTTGATCGECAHALIKAGAAAVSVLTLAHAG